MDKDYLCDSVLHKGNVIVNKLIRKSDKAAFAGKLLEDKKAKTEISILKELHTPLPHPQIISLEDVTPHSEGHTYLVFPLIEDQTKMLKPEKTTLIRYYFYHLLKAVEYMHSHKIVHFDLKPANILFDGKRVILIDFGNALRFQDITFGCVGTGSYAAPELHAEDDRLMCEQTDVWSLAVILCEMLTGTRLFPKQDDDKKQRDEVTTFAIAATNGQLELDSNNTHLSEDDADEVRELLSDMFQEISSNRPTVSQCLKSSWFQNMESEDMSTVLCSSSSSSSSSVDVGQRKQPATFGSLTPLSVKVSSASAHSASTSSKCQHPLTTTMSASMPSGC